MKVINFSHPFTKAQLQEIEAQIGQFEVVTVKSQFDYEQSFGAQVINLVDEAGLPDDGEPLVINLPAMGSIAALAIAEIHGRTGHFPKIIRLIQKEDGWHLAEIIDLQKQRNESRTRRS